MPYIDAPLPDPWMDVEKAATDWDGWMQTLDEAKRADIERAFMFSTPDTLQADRKRFISVASVAQDTGIDAMEISTNFENMYQPLFANQVLGKNEVGVGIEPFFNEIVGRKRRDREERELLFGLEDDSKDPDGKVFQNSLAYLARESAYAGEMQTQALGKWQQLNAGKPGFDSTHIEKYVGVMRSEYDLMQEKASKVRPIATEAYHRIARARGREYGDGDAMPVELFRGLSPEEKSLAFRVMKDLSAGADEKRFWQVTVEGLTRGAEFLFPSSGAAAWREKLMQSHFKEGDVVAAKSKSATDEVGAEFTAYSISRMGSNSGGAGYARSQEAKRTLSAKEAEQWNQQLEGAIEDVDTAEQLRLFGQQVIDPIKSGSVAIQKVWKPVAETLPIMSVMALPSSWAPALEVTARAYQGETYLDLISQGMDKRQANEQAFVTGVAKAGMDKLEFGLYKRLPFFGRAVEKFTLGASRGARWSARAAATLGVETVQELGQDVVIPALVQDAMAADPKWDVKWGEVWGEAWNAAPDTALGMVILSALGASYQTMKDSAVVKALSESPSAMRLRGYTPDQIEEITKAGTLEEKGKLLAKNLPAKAPAGEAATALVKDALSMAADERQDMAPKIEALQNLEATGVLPPMVKSQDGYEIRLQDGTKATYPTLEAAQQARWELPEVAAMKMHESVREVIDNSERSLAEGQGKQVEFTGQSPTDESRLASMEEGAEKDALQKQLQERAQITDLDGGASEQQTYETATAVVDATAQSPEEAMAARAILGESVDEFKDGILLSVSKINNGATPLTIVEETVEPAARRIIGQTGGRDFLLSGLRDTEAKLGEKLLLTKDDSQVSDQQLIEAFSKLGVSMFVGESLAGNQRGRANRLWLSAEQKRIARQSKLGKVLDAFAVMLSSVFRRASKVMELRAKGEFHKGLETELAQALGLEQRHHEAAVVQEASSIASAVVATANGRMAPVDGRSEVSFSMGPELPSGRDEVDSSNEPAARYLPEENAGSSAQERLGLAVNAARGSDATVESERGIPAHERWDREEERLEAFFRENDMPTAWTPPDGATMLEGGNEHVLYKVGPDLYKVTKLDSYGKVLKYEPQAHDGLNMVHASPSEYLSSLALRNQFFAGQVGLVGMRRNRVMEIVTKMPFHDAKNPKRPHPSSDTAVRDHMQKAGFREVGPGAFYNASNNLLVGDGKIDNFIQTKFGIVPVDISVTHPDEAFREFLTTGKKSYALSPGELPARLAKLFDPYQRSPELRDQLYQEAQRRLDAVRQDIDREFVNKNGQLVRIQSEGLESVTERNRAKSNLQAEARFRQAQALERILQAKGLDTKDAARSKDSKDYERLQRYQESKHLLTQSGLTEEDAEPLAQASAQKWRDNLVTNVKESISEAKQEADAWLKGAIAKIPDQRTQIVAWIRALDAVLSALPAEVRGRVGGYARLASLTTDEARLKFIQERAAKMDAELERWLRRDFSSRFERLLKRAEPKKDEVGRKRIGKAGADIHALFEVLREARDWDAVKAEAHATALEAQIAAGEMTAEQEAHVSLEAGLVRQVGDWANADAARMASALQNATFAFEEGYARYRLRKLQEREDRQIMRDLLITSTGADGTRTERAEMERQASTIVGKARGLGLDISSFSEVLRHAFGEGSQEARSLEDGERNASNQYEDAIQATGNAVQDLFTRLAGGSVLDGERLRFDMAQRTIPTRAAGPMSQMEAVTALLMWRQEDGRRHMEGRRDENNQVISSWSYDQSFIDGLEASLTPQARALMDWISTQYAAEYEPINRLHRERHGINLPSHKHYAPLTVRPVQVAQGQVADPVTGVVGASGSIFTPGSLRTRGNATAEPDFRDALQVFLAHNKQMQWWAAYYDVAMQTRAVLGNREVMNAVEASSGPEAGAVIKKWMDVFAEGGSRDAAAGLSVTETTRRMASRAATVALLGRVSTLLVQSTQLAAASVHMPVGAYLSRFGRLMSGQLNWRDAVNSQFIQRRIQTAPPLVRQAMESLGTATRPNQISRAVRFLGDLLAGADGLFTGGTYAILLDWHRTQGAEMGFSGRQLEEYAHAEAERTTEQVAQPVRMATRSITEVTMTNPFARVIWSYASESRQKLALAGWAASRATDNPVYAAKVAFLTFIVGGLGSQVLKNIWREMKGDDDERKWSAERLMWATVSGPIHGMPLVSEILGNPGIFSALQWAPGAASRLIQADYDSATDMLRDVDTILSAAGYFNDTAAGVAALSHAGLDFAKLLENAVVDD